MTPRTSVALPGRAVLLPGAGSDGIFVRRVFGGALVHHGTELTVIEWAGDDPAQITARALQRLEREARKPGPLLVGGVSLGAAVALGWALARPDRAAGVVLAMPAWLGPSDDAPAALAARMGASALRTRGLAAVLREIDGATPPWLSAELRRAWSAQGTPLAAVLDACARHRAPTAAEVGELDVPLGVAGVSGDPLHPLAVARELVAAAARARLTHTPLAAVGADPGELGRAAVRAWRAAATLD